VHESICINCFTKLRIRCIKKKKKSRKASFCSIVLEFMFCLQSYLPRDPRNLKITCIIWSALDMIATYFISSERSFHHFLHELSVLRRHGTYVQLAHDLCVFYLGILINSRASSGFL